MKHRGRYIQYMKYTDLIVETNEESQSKHTEFVNVSLSASTHSQINHLHKTLLLSASTHSKINHLHKTLYDAKILNLEYLFILNVKGCGPLLKHQLYLVPKSLSPSSELCEYFRIIVHSLQWHTWA